ncbi:MAG: hypothetical protein PHD11_09570 [Bacteroidales bacterium]|nr:hypothetical protein [Bacteroidales bacterium]MDD4670277.1 hypothetical protein [Bacteroidales bacterium]
MKKLLILLLVVFSVQPIYSTISNCRANQEDETDIIVNTIPPQRSLNGIRAFYTPTTLYVTFSDYTGMVSSEIKDNDGTVVSTASGYINGSGRISHNIVNLQSGTYEIIISANLRYSGSFSLNNWNSGQN